MPPKPTFFSFLGSLFLSMSFDHSSLSSADSTSFLGLLNNSALCWSSSMCLFLLLHAWLVFCSTPKIIFHCTKLKIATHLNTAVICVGWRFLYFTPPPWLSLPQGCSTNQPPYFNNYLAVTSPNSGSCFAGVFYRYRFRLCSSGNGSPVPLSIIFYLPPRK